MLNYMDSFVEGITLGVILLLIFIIIGVVQGIIRWLRIKEPFLNCYSETPIFLTPAGVNCLLFVDEEGIRVKINTKRCV